MPCEHALQCSCQRRTPRTASIANAIGWHVCCLFRGVSRRVEPSKSYANTASLASLMPSDGMVRARLTVGTPLAKLCQSDTVVSFRHTTHRVTQARLVQPLLCRQALEFLRLGKHGEAIAWPIRVASVLFEVF